MAGQTKIGRFLKSRGSSQNEAAKVIGVSVTTFSSKANGLTQFKQNEMKRLAEHYGMDAVEIKNVFL